MEYETHRISYVDDNGKERITIIDFYDEKTNTLYEIKPSSIYKIQQKKMNAVINHCKKNKIKFYWINEHNILDYVDINKFDKFNIMQYNKMLKGIKNENSKNKNH